MHICFSWQFRNFFFTLINICDQNEKIYLHEWRISKCSGEHSSIDFPFIVFKPFGDNLYNWIAVLVSRTALRYERSISYLRTIHMYALHNPTPSVVRGDETYYLLFLVPGRLFSIMCPANFKMFLLLSRRLTSENHWLMSTRLHYRWMNPVMWNF